MGSGRCGRSSYAGVYHVPLEPVATIGERVATLEQIARDAHHRIAALEHQMSGGGDVDFERSVRGRLHKLETVAAAAVLRRNLGVGLLKGWERVVIVTCAILTAAAAWYGLAIH